MYKGMFTLVSALTHVPYKHLKWGRDMLLSSPGSHMKENWSEKWKEIKSNKRKADILFSLEQPAKEDVQFQRKKYAKENTKQEISPTT